MAAGQILLCVAAVMVAAALWSSVKRKQILNPAAKTYLIVAVIFALVGAVVALLQ